MREYELTVVYRTDIDESQQAELQERLLGWLGYGDEQEGEPIIHQWGQRSLAYPIKKETEGYYVFYEVKLEPSAVADVERNILYTDEILRHLFVRKEA